MWSCEMLVNLTTKQGPRKGRSECPHYLLQEEVKLSFKVCVCSYAGDTGVMTVLARRRPGKLAEGSLERVKAQKK